MSMHAQTDRLSRLRELRSLLKSRCVAALNGLAHELSVIESDQGYNVELRHLGVLQLFATAQDAAFEVGFTLHYASEVAFVHDRFVGTGRIEVLDADSSLVMRIARQGEALPSRTNRKSGEIIPSETAVRTAETRALKRAIGMLVPEVDAKLAYLSRLVEGWARTKRTSDTKQLEAWLVAWMEKYGFRANGSDKVETAQTNTSHA